MKNRGLWFLLGFILTILGFTSIFLQLVGTRWAFLSFLEWGGRLPGFILKILMSMSGIVIVVLANTDWDRERRDSEGLD